MALQNDIFITVILSVSLEQSSIGYSKGCEDENHSGDCRRLKCFTKNNNTKEHCVYRYEKGNQKKVGWAGDGEGFEVEHIGQRSAEQG